MPSYTDIFRVPGVWRDASIASAASEAIRTTGAYTPGAPSPSFTPSNASSVVDVQVTPSNASTYERLRGDSERISRGLVNGTVSRSEVEAYNAKVLAFAKDG